MTISICVVALNEEGYIRSLLADILNQDFPHEQTEIVLIDSGSSDNTKAIMEDFANDHRDEYIGVKVLDNPKGIQSAGWNVAIKSFSCDALIRIDAHTSIPSDFVSKNVNNLVSGEFVSGGKRPCLIEEKTPWKETLLDAENSLFGSGIAVSRHSNEKRYVKSMFHAAYKREVFESVGLFNEALLRTEDNEMHYRIRKHGYKLLYDPSIVSYQYARNSLRKMIKQKYLNGYWIGLTSLICPKCLSLYHFAPFVFVSCLAASVVSAFFNVWIPLAALLGLYLLFAVSNSILARLKKQFNPTSFFLPILFFILHFSYGVGTFVGLLLSPWFAIKTKHKYESKSN